MIFPLAFGQNTADIVGVKAGDWVRYEVVNMGAQTIWRDLYDNALWIKVEVQNVSATNVAVHETKHLRDGKDRITTITYDLQSLDTAPAHFIPSIIISLNLEPGDVIEQCDIWTANGNWTNAQLTLNHTTLRNYSGMTREVNVLEFSQCLPYFEYTANLTHKCYWDKETGFMLERIEQMAFLGYAETYVSKVRLEIADTNLWEKEVQPFLNNSWSLAIVGLAVTAAVGTVITLKSLKNKENKTNVYARANLKKRSTHAQKKRKGSCR